MSSKYKMNVQELDIEIVEKWEDNPNQMNDSEFNALCNELDANGLIDPIQVVGPQEDGKYLILGGHHRYDAARVLGWSEIACVVLAPDEWKGEKVEFQNIKMNVLKGNLNPQKMMKWYEDKAKHYSAEALAELTGHVNIDAFLKIVGEMRKSIKDSGLPDDIKDKVAETLSEVKTIDGLSNVLNSIFAKYGDTLKYGFVSFSYGGQNNLYVQATKETWNIVNKMKDECCEKQIDINILFGKALKNYDKLMSEMSSEDKFDGNEDKKEPEKKTKAKTKSPDPA